MTLIIIPIEGVDDSRLIESFDKIPAYFKRLEKNRYFNVEVKTEWKMFMYANEYISNQLAEALPIILRATEYHYFSFYKIVFDDAPRYSISPRLFDSRIKLRDNAVYPVDVESFKGITILDGFIFQC